MTVLMEPVNECVVELNTTTPGNETIGQRIVRVQIAFDARILRVQRIFLTTIESDIHSVAQNEPRSEYCRV